MYGKLCITTELISLNPSIQRLPHINNISSLLKLGMRKGHFTLII